MSPRIGEGCNFAPFTPLAAPLAVSRARNGLVDRRLGQARVGELHKACFTLVLLFEVFSDAVMHVHMYVMWKTVRKPLKICFTFVS